MIKYYIFVFVGYGKTEDGITQGRSLRLLKEIGREGVKGEGYHQRSRTVVR